MSDLHAWVTLLEQTQMSHADILVKTQLQLEDLENRSRRSNLRLRGIPEATVSEDLGETVHATLSRVVTTDPPVSFEFDRVHRALGVKSTDPDRPWDVICRLHRYGVKGRVLWEAWAKRPA